MIVLMFALAMQTADLDSAASLSRVRARLEQPAPLKLAVVDVPRPTFRVEVRGDRFWIEQPPIWKFKVPPMSPLLPPVSVGEPGFAPTGGTDVLPAFAAALHALRERAARKEVQKAIAEFCAVHDCGPR